MMFALGIICGLILGYGGIVVASYLLPKTRVIDKAVRPFSPKSGESAILMPLSDEQEAKDKYIKQQHAEGKDVFLNDL